MSLPLRTSHLTRDWAFREYALACGLVLVSGAGAMFYYPDEVTAPGSIRVLALFILATTAATWATCMSPRFRVPRWLAVAALLFIGQLVGVWYGHWQPIFDMGSDNDEAVFSGARQLLSFEFPWSAVTQLGNPLSPMLGGFLLAIPFALIPYGTFLHQMFWFAAMTVFLKRKAGLHATVMVAALLFLSPGIRLELAIESDNWIVGLLVLMTGSWGYWVLREDRSRLQWWLSAVSFAVALCYRATVWVVVLPLIVLFVRAFGLRKSFPWFACAGSVLGILVLAPLAVDADTYLKGPFAQTFNKVTPGVEHAGLIVIAVTLVAAIGFSVMARDLASAWLAAAFSMAATTMAVVATQAVTIGWLAAFSSHTAVSYSGPWLVIGLIALALPRSKRSQPSVGRATANTPLTTHGLPAAGRDTSD